MAQHSSLYTDLVEDDYEGYYSELAGDTSVNTKGARNKRNNGMCYSSKHVRIALAASQTSKGTKSK
jgi:hypothetical protein